MACIKLEDVHKNYGKVVAVNHINLEIKEGEYMALLGPSGCGKTTTLRMIAGLEKPTYGKMFFDELLINNKSPRDRNVAMVFERHALYPHLKVYDNIAMPLKIRRYSKEEIDRRVKAFAKILEISDRLDHWPSQLSGGQRQRVGIARALVREPVVFLLDEPISHLDAKLRIHMRAELKRLHRIMGITTIHVTHDQVEAMSIADRIAVMGSGIIQQVGRPYELFNKPANLYVAGFIGEPSMNFLPSLIEKDDEKGLVLKGEGFNCNFSSDIRKRIKDDELNKELVVGFRPQHCRIELGDTKGREELTGFMGSGVISLIEVLGTEQVVHINLNNKDLKWIGPSNISLEVEDKIKLYCNEDNIFIFNKETEKCILAYEQIKI